MNTKAILNAIESHFLASGLYSWVNTHEPKNAPEGELGCAIFMETIRPVPQASGLSKSAALVVFNARSYIGMIQEPEDEIDTNLGAVTDTMLTRLFGDFTLGGTVRNIDLHNIAGVALEARTGYVELGGKVFRVVDITIPCIVNDVWPQSP